MSITLALSYDRYRSDVDFPFERCELLRPFRKRMIVAVDTTRHNHQRSDLIVNGHSAQVHSHDGNAKSIIAIYIYIHPFRICMMSSHRSRWESPIQYPHESHDIIVIQGIVHHYHYHHIFIMNVSLSSDMIFMILCASTRQGRTWLHFSSVSLSNDRCWSVLPL